MPKFHIGIARFPFGNQEAPSVTDWLVRTVSKMKADALVGDITNIKEDDTPITMSRNSAMEKAEKAGVDLLLMIDSDMYPDIGLQPGTAIPGAKPFWDTALDFCLQHKGPCVVAAPYCGPPPFENVYIFHPDRKQSDNPNCDVAIEQFSRHHAAQLSGAVECIALPTGLMLIDMRCVKALSHPYFDYDWEADGPACEHCGLKKPGRRSKKASTEDVYFSRNLALAGVPQYALADCWAGHWKRKLVTKPQLLTMDAVQKQYREAILRGQVSTERLIDLGAGGVKAKVPDGIPVVSSVDNGRPAQPAPAKTRPPFRLPISTKKKGKK